MRRLLKQVTATLESFVIQRDAVAMILTAAPADATPLLSILEGIEAGRPSDFFWTFTDPFTSASAYAEAVVQAFAVKHEAVRLAMEKEGMAPWPPIPATVTAPSILPAQRLRALAAFSRELLPVPDGGVTVWTFFPLEIADAAAYAGLMAQVIAHEFPFPWCHHLRFVLRDEPGNRPLERLLEGAPRIERFAPDLSLEALNRSLDGELADETLSLAERMALLQVSASSDLAFGRLPLALEKYALMLQYHGPMNDHAMAAVAMIGMGQAYERMGDLDIAGEAYQAALIPASHGEHLPIPVFLNAVLGLATLRMAQERWAEAEGYWDAAQQLATVARDGPLKIRALDNRGICQERQGSLEAAEQSWRAGTILAAQLEDLHFCRSLVERLRSFYAAQGDADKERQLREHLVALGRPVED